MNVKLSRIRMCLSRYHYWCPFNHERNIDSTFQFIIFSGSSQNALQHERWSELPGLDPVSRPSTAAPFGTPFTLHTVGIVVIPPEMPNLPESNGRAIGTPEELMAGSFWNNLYISPGQKDMTPEWREKSENIKVGTMLIGLRFVVWGSWLCMSWFCRSWLCCRGIGVVGLGFAVGGLGFGGLGFVVGGLGVEVLVL
jgi:hypothetical protein